MFVRMRCLAVTVMSSMALLVGRVGAAGPVETATPRPPADIARIDAHGDPLPAGARARLGTIRFRHGSAVLRLAASADGKRFATLGHDHYLRLWDASSGREIRGIPFSNADDAQSLAFSPNGRMLLAAIADTGIHLWDAATGDAINTFENTNSVIATAAWSPDGKTIVTADHTDTVRIWDVATGKESRQLKWQPPAKQVKKDTGIVGLVRWYIKKLEELDEENGGAAGGPLVYNASNAVFSPDGKYLAACGPLVENGQVQQQHYRIWEVGTWKSVTEWTGAAAHGQPRLRYSPDGKVLAATDPQEQLHLFDSASGKDLRTLGEAGLAAFAFSPDGKTLALSNALDAVRLFEVETGKETKVLQGQPQGQMSLAFTADGRRLAAAGFNNHIHFWDLASGKAISPFGGHTRMVVNSFTIAKGKQIVTCGAEGSIRVWDAATGRQLRELPPLAEAANLPFHTFAVSSDGKRLAHGYARHDMTNNKFADAHIHVFDMDTGKETLKLPLGERMPSALEFAADGRRLAGAVHGGVHIWDVQTGKQIRHLAPEMPKVADEGPDDIQLQVPDAIAFSPDGRLLITVDGNLLAGIPGGINPRAVGLPPETVEMDEHTVTIWEMATGKKRRQFTVESSSQMLDPTLMIDLRGQTMGTAGFLASSTAIRFAPRGKAFLLGSGRNIYLHDLARGTEVRRFGGPRLNGQSVAFSPDGKLLAAGSHDGRIYLWDVRTGTLVHRSAGHRGSVNHVTFSPDGQTLITAGADTTGLVWDVAGLLAQPESARAAALSPERLKSLWEELGTMEADKAETAMRELGAVPTDVVPYLARQLKPQTVKLDASDVDRLIKDLDGATFDLREKAMKDLERLERGAESALRKALAEPQTSLELRRRMERLIERLDAPVTEPERLRELRGVEVLEQVATPEAKEILERLAKGTPGLGLTREAKAALARLK